MASLPARRSWVADRIGPAIGVAAIHALLGYALITGLRVPGRFVDASASLTVLNLKPPPPELPRKPREPIKQGGGSPAPKARPPPPIIAPIPAIPAPPPLTIVPPVIAGGGPAGAGTGGIGSGTGQGSGGAGSGQGEGVGNGRGFSGARQVRGRFRNSDFPASAKGAGRLKIGVRYAIGPSGRVDQCEIIEPSGYPEVDAMTCHVIVDRYRFKPARDEQGVPVTEVMEEDYSWTMD